MRILHTADWQLGWRAAPAGERAAEVRHERLAAVGRLVELAHSQAVDLVLVAGDTFDRQDVDEALVLQTIERLEAFAPIPTVILPGNHDPWVLGGVWTRSAWSRLGDHVTIVREAVELTPIPGVVIYPCPVLQKRSQRDPTAWIPPRRQDDETLRIGLAHGSLDALPGAANFPIARDRAELAGLDYLALGDWHGVQIFGRTAYPGTVEQTSYSERHPGYALVVDLECGREPRIEQHRVGRFVWLSDEQRVADRTDLERLEQRIRSAARPSDLLLRITVTRSSSEAGGRRDEHLESELERLRSELAGSLFALEWSERGLPPVVELPAGLLSEADRALEQAASGSLVDGAPESLLDADPVVLEEARALLRRLVASARAEMTA